jgi:hypothetical protein
MAVQKEMFSSSHSWIFASLSGSPEAGSTLSEIVMRADMLNRAIPNPDEIVSALETLHSHGLIKIENDLTALTVHGQKVLANGLARRGGLFSIIENVGKALNSPAFDHPAISGRADTSFLTDVAYATACNEYHQRFTSAVKSQAKE